MDITMCANGGDCPRRKQCHRYTAIITNPERQSMAAFYKQAGDDECMAFWNNKGRAKRNTP